MARHPIMHSTDSGRDHVATGITSRKPAPDSNGSLPRSLRLVHDIAGQSADLEPGFEVIAGNVPSGSIWLVKSGVLRLQRHAYDGRRQILSLFLPGEIVGYENLLREGMSVETATPCGLCRIDRRAFDDLLGKDPALRNDFIRIQQHQLDRLHWLTWSIGALGPEDRFCAFLALSTRFMPYQRLPDGTGVLTMLLSRMDIADMLATTVESISRITHRLSGTAVIEIRDPLHFRILDLGKLIALGRIEGLFDWNPFGLGGTENRLNGLMRLASNQPVSA